MLPASGWEVSRAATASPAVSGSPTSTDRIEWSASRVDEGALVPRWGTTVPGTGGTRSAEAPASPASVSLPSAPGVAGQCVEIALGSLSLDERTARITDILVPAIEAAPSPDPAWTKATPQEVRLYVQETLEHTDGVRAVGRLRGEDFTGHDLEGDTSKFNPDIAQFLARPGRDDSVKWAMARHNDAPHHRAWNDPTSQPADLRESASDVIGAWRMERRVYDKPSWSWQRIEATIAADHDDGRLTTAQRDALLQAIPFQRAAEGPLTAAA